MFVAILLLCAAQRAKIRQLSGERDKYRNDTETLLSGVEQYRVRDSLNAARVQSLELSVKEYEKYRAKDAALIRELKGRNRDLATVNETQTETIIELRARPKDTVIVVRDSIMVPAVAVHCGDSWYDFDGVLTADEFSGNLTSRDSLLVAETVRYRRFLGFLWKTNKVRDRRVDVVSRNPHTKIVDVEFVFLKK